MPLCARVSPTPIAQKDLFEEFASGFRITSLLYCPGHGETSAAYHFCPGVPRATVRGMGEIDGQAVWGASPPGQVEATGNS